MPKRHVKKIPLLKALIGIGILVFLVDTFLIDHSIKAPKLKNSKGSALYTTSNKNYSTSIGEKDGTPKVVFSVGKSQAGFVMAGLTDKKVQKIDNNTVQFTNVQKNTDLKYTTLPNGLKEEIILKEKPDRNTFLFDLLLNNVVPKTLTNGFVDPNFKDLNGNYQFHFEKPFAIDAKNNRTDNVLLQISEDKQIKGKYSLKLVVDPTWLNDPNRAYPITIDPTIVHDTTAEFATGQLNRLKDTGSGSTPSLETYYQELPSDQYTAGLWHMNEASGNTLDSSGNANTGTPTGTTVVAGLLNNARSFNGSSDFINAGNGSSLPRSGDITLEAWINTTDIGNSLVILSHGTTSDWLYALSKTTANGLQCKFYQAASGVAYNEVISTIPINDGTWHHVGCVIRDNKVTLYLDGNPIGFSATVTGSRDVATAGSLSIGRFNWTSTLNWSGAIDEVRISNTARAAEEIKSSASRRPYSVYTSDVLDFSANILSWNPLQWTELGVNTGDGETLKDSTSLVAQWNLNGTSGTTATNDAGSCGATCDGTLTSFASTGSQDAAADTGWTSDNRRWGAGALMFDGTNDYVRCDDTNCGGTSRLDLGSNAFTVSAWIKTSSTAGGYVLAKGVSSGQYSYQLTVAGPATGGTAGLVYWQLVNNANTLYSGGNSTKYVADGNWHYVVGTWNPSNTTTSLYIDGKLEYSSISTSGTLVSDSTAEFNIGRRADNTGYFNGIIDSVTVYSRALGSNEIMSNYQAGNIELQTRVGSDTSPDDGSWEDWKPTTGETTIDGFDTPLSKDLIGYWPMDEASATRYDKWSTSNLTANGTGGVGTGVGILNGAADFESSESDFLEIADNTALSTGDIDFTISAWVKLESKSTQQVIVSKYDGGAGAAEFLVYYDQTADRFVFSTYDSSAVNIGFVIANNFGSPSTGVWYNVVAQRTASTNALSIQVNNGTSNTSTDTGAMSDTTSNFRVGAFFASEVSFFDGLIDEVGFWKRVLSSDEVSYLYGSGSPKNTIFGTDITNLSQFGGIRPSAETVVVQENSASTKYSTGRMELDSATVALWHLDETSGSGAYLKDVSTNANHGTPTGTTVVNGMSGKARLFSGTDVITVPAANGSSLDLDALPITLEAWVKPTSITPGALSGIVGRGVTGTNGYGFGMNTTGVINAGGYGGSNFDGAIPLKINQWNYVVAVINGASSRIYVNGQADNTGTNTIVAASTNLYIGARANGASPTTTYFPGTIDQVRVSNVARSAEEIAETYRAGRDHYINKTISTTDLSGKSTLPFYIAADRPGSYLSTIVGESAFVNGQPDTNTLGLWRLDEQPSISSYIKDSSGNGHHINPTGTTFSQGKIGGSRYFRGGSNGDHLTVTTDGSTFSLNTYTTDAWVYPTGGSTTTRFILDKRDSSVDGYYMYLSSSDLFGCGYNSFATHSTSIPPLNNWYHITCVSDGSTLSLYVNGVLESSVAISGSIAVTADSTIGGRSFTKPSNTFFGSIDEVRFSNTARTTTEIRQAYEVGLRTHPITIDFASAISHTGPLSDNNDLTFTLMATPSGTTNAGDNIFKGDKIIVRENYDGTDYIAQGTVDSVNISTGATTVSSWDAGSTFPSIGFTPNATVFKWQREYWNINNETLDTSTNAITNLTLRLTDGNEGRTIWIDDLKSNDEYLTTSTGSTITSSTGNRYFQYRAILSSFDEAVSATLSAVTVDYVINVAPNTPTLDSPANSATNQILSPILRTTTTDTESDYLRYKIELCTNVGMTTGCQTFDQTSSQTGWSGQNAQTSTAYTSGTQATYTIQTPLATTTTYYWRSYAIDPAGINLWSATQVSPYSFTTTTAPTAPTTPYAEGATNPTGVGDITPEFSAIHNDGNGDDANYYEIEVNTNNTFTGTVMWDTGAVSMSNLANGVRSTDVSYAGTTIPLDGAGTTYYWRIRFTDVNGATGSWSATQSFTMSLTPGAPSLDLPINLSSDVPLKPILKTTGTDSNSDDLRYRIVICTDVLMTVSCQTFNQTLSQTGWTGQNALTSTAYTSGTQATYTLQSDLSPATTYYWQSYVIDPNGSNTWSLANAPHSFTTVVAPYAATVCNVQETENDTSLTVLWFDNAYNEDNYEIQRSVDGGAYFVLVSSLPPDTFTYTDNTITSGHTYSYRIAPYFDMGPTYATWCVASTLDLGTGNFRMNGLKLDGLKFN